LFSGPVRPPVVAQYPGGTLLPDGVVVLGVVVVGVVVVPPVELTTMVPVITLGWRVHLYGNVPAVVKVWLALAPGCIGPVSNPVPAGSWATAPLFTQVTVVPGLMVRVAGWKAKSIIVTVTLEVPGVVVGVLGVVGVVLVLLPQPASITSGTTSTARTAVAIIFLFISASFSKHLIDCSFS